jgi:PiT family inorganic phosphate transporter
MDLIVLLALGVGLYMAWTLGANDVANAMGTSVGSGALTLRRAIVVAAIFEFAGAVLVGSHVTETIRRGILDPIYFGPAGPFGVEGPTVLALGMTAALLGAALWLQAATLVGLPVSTTHSIVGAVVGFGVVSVGLSGIEWTTLGSIVASWVVSPVLGGLLGFVAFVAVRRLVLRQEDPVAATRAVAPYMVGVVGFILALTFVYKALANVIRDPHPVMTTLAAAAFGGVSLLMFRALLQAMPEVSPGRDSGQHVERVFGWLQIVTAAFVAFAHGANDVANAVGPVAAVVGIAAAGFTEVPDTISVSGWLLAAGGAGIVIGLATWGYRVIATIGKRITEITPTRGFSAEFGTACTVLLASRLGLPVSTTHVLVGSVVGVGLAQGLGALDLRTVRDILYSWIATVPAAAVLGAGIFVGLRELFL